MKYASIVYILVFHIVYSMETPDSEMIKIEKWEDLTPYSGKIIAFISGTGFRAHKGCNLILNTGLQYGYVARSAYQWSGSGEWGYSIHQLIRSKDVDVTQGWTNSLLNEIKLSIRHVSEYETISIRALVKNKHAHFEHLFFVTEEELFGECHKII